jgi:ferrous iron transport protein A
MDFPDQLVLANVQPGNLVYVRKVENHVLKPKLMEMGIVKGQPLYILFKAPFGDPIAIDVNGYVLSLRLDEARLITVEKELDPSKTNLR